MHQQAYDWVRTQAARLRPDAVLEIGSHDVNGGVRSLFETAEVYHGIDIAPGPGVDEVADAATWVPNRTFDAIVTTEVLEHAPHWTRILTMAFESLTPGGTLIMTCAADPRGPHSAVDGLDVRPGEHYANVAPTDLMGWLNNSGCSAWEVEIHEDRGDLYLRASRDTMHATTDAPPSADPVAT
jgi:hypothetical protein